MIICLGGLIVLLLIAFVLLKAWIMGEEGVRQSKRRAWVETLSGLTSDRLETQLEALKQDAAILGLYPGIPDADRIVQEQRVIEDKKRIEILEKLISERWSRGPAVADD